MLKEEKTAQLLTRANKTLAIAESCTGGLLANRLTNIPGSSEFLRLGLVTYSNESKVKILKVPQSIIRKHGAVSSQTAIAMAKGVQKILKTDFGVGITGIAGPSGGSKTKPVGLVHMAVCTDLETLCLECQFRGTRKSIKSQAATVALRLLNEFLV